MGARLERVFRDFFFYALFCSCVGLWDGASARDFGESAMFFAVAEKKKTIDMNAHGFVSRDEVVRASGATSRRCSRGRFSSRPILSLSREGSFLGPSAMMMMMMMLLAFDLSRCVVFFYVALALPLL